MKSINVIRDFVSARMIMSGLFCFCLLFFLCTAAYCLDLGGSEGVCGPDSESSKSCDIISVPPGKLPLLLPDSEDKTASSSQDRGKNDESAYEPKQASSGKEFVVYLFWGKGCPHCEEEKEFPRDIKKVYPGMKVVDREVWYDKKNAALLAQMAEAYDIKAAGVPITFVGNNVFIGFSRHSRQGISTAFQKCSSGDCMDPSLVLSKKAVISKTTPSDTGAASGKPEELECTEKNKTVYIPWIGNLDTSDMSLPVVTLVIAGLDSFNPCAFFVLFSLLGLLIHARSRFKMLLIGSEFVFFSGFIYFLFMAAWLNVFLIMGKVEIITTIAALIAVVIAIINIKDFFAFKKGVSLTIPDSAKPRLFDRMRKLMKSTSLPSIIVGTAVLAIAANSYELLCTAGFPMVYTRILTLKKLSSLSYYLYLVLYNVVYVIPLSIIVGMFTVTLGRKVLTDSQGRMLKLVSGTMMLGLGGVLFFDPALMNNVLVSFLLLLGTILLSVIISWVTRKAGLSH